MFHYVGGCGTRLNERTARRFEEPAIECMPSPVLGYLARTSRDDVLVALPAALSVVRRPKTVLHGFNFFKDEPAIVERAQRHDIVFIDCIEVWSLDSEAVGQVVKTGKSFVCVPLVADSTVASWHGKKSGGTFGRRPFSRSKSFLKRHFAGRLTGNGTSKNRDDGNRR